MFSMKILLVMYILSISISSLSCLPVTSKPIENTPEHLAWEAWIMVPPTHDKIRKITPKSIFILPNKTNGGGNGGSNTHQLQCPPGHQAHDSRCIPLVTIDRNQILIAQLTNLLQSTDKFGTDGNNNESLNYDYDYDDYADGYNPEGSEPLVQSHVPPDYNGEPLKINLSLDKFPVTKDDNKNVGNFGDLEDVDDTEEDLKVQPFRGKQTTTTSTTEPLFSEPTKGHFTQTTPVTIKRAENQYPTIDFGMHLSDSSQGPKSPPATVARPNPTPSVLILSQSETEMSSVKPTATNETDTDFDYSLSDLTTFRTTGENDDEFDIVTEVEGSKTSFKDDLIKEFLVFNKHAANNTDITKGPEESTEVTDLLTTTTVDSDDEDSVAQTDKFDKAYTTTSKKLEDQTFNQNESADKIKINTSPKVESEKQELRPGSNHKIHEPIQLQEDKEPLLENIESSNRFVYHHLDPTTRHRPDRPDSSVPEIQEQLRIINRIVEENKRRAHQQTRVKFPTGSNEHHQQQHFNYRDYTRFIDSTNSPPYPPPPPLYRGGSDQYAMHKHFTDQMQSSATAYTGENNKNSKPIWWLPNGWEVDRNGDRPLLLRFWSRAPNEQHPDQTSRHRNPSSPSTTSGYRENSRSPTENLYKEISAQEVYKVLGAKQWKHNR